MTYKQIEQLAKENNYQELYDYYQSAEKINGEVRWFDEEKDLVTLSLYEDGTIEYMRRATPSTKDDLVWIKVTK